MNSEKRSRALTDGRQSSMASAAFLSSSISFECPAKPTFVRTQPYLSATHPHKLSTLSSSFDGHRPNGSLTAPKGPWRRIAKSSRFNPGRSSGLSHWLEYDGSKRRSIETRASRSSWSIPSDWYKPDVLAQIWNGRVLPGLAQVTPLEASKWAAVAAVLIGAVKLLTGFFLNPYLWVYGSWILIVWPWPAAILLGLSSLIAVFKKSKGKARAWEQVLILAGALTWLIIVPLAHFNGYIEGWPVMLLLVYFGFFLISSYIRYTLYGDLSPRSRDRQWQSTPSRIAQMAFVTSVVGGHWLAAYESPPLYMIPGGWHNTLPMLLLFLAVVLQYNATYYLGKYFDRLVVPQAVVMFGPYRWIRHPIYASYMLLFAGYCTALRAYWSLVFLLVACFLYYEQRTKLEEDMLVEAFGDVYAGYRKKVPRKYIPFVY